MSDVLQFRTHLKRVRICTSCILNYLSGYIESAYSRYGAFKNFSLNLKMLKESILRIVDGEDGNVGKLEELMCNVPQSEDEYYLIQFRTNFTGDANIYEDYICCQLEIKWRGAICIAKDSHILMLLNITSYSSLNKNDFFQEMVLFLRDSLLVAGISRKFTDLNDLHAAYNQTNIVLTLGPTQNATSWYFKFDDYALDYLLKNGCGDFTSDQVCSNALVILRRHDKKYNTQYYLTLYEYMKSQYNSTKAAKSLYIARSSFLNRLDRIHELTNINISDWTDRVYLAISFQIYNQYE